MKRLVSLLLAASLISSLAFFSSCAREKQFSKTDITVFDTQTIILGCEESEAEFDKNADRMISLLSEYHKLFDIYYEYDGINNLKTVNDNAGKAPVAVDGRVIEMLLFAKEMYTLSEGKVNVAMGSVLSVWHKYREAGLDDPENAVLPTMEELQEAALHTDINKVIIDEENGTVFLEDEKMSLDVGAIAKGWSVEAVADIMESEGLTGYAMSVGGNVRCMGKKPWGDRWEIGIQNPDLTSAKAYSATVYLEREALVTSGTYQRFYTVDEKQYHHIIDPKTLMPSEHFASVSVIIEDSGKGDALSTALFNMSEKEGRALCERLGAEALWVYNDQSTKSTAGFEKLTEN